MKTITNNQEQYPGNSVSQSQGSDGGKIVKPINNWLPKDLYIIWIRSIMFILNQRRLQRIFLKVGRILKN